jgi:hypothetical protein
VLFRSTSFSEDTAIEINELDIEGFAGTSVGGVTVTAAFNIKLAGEPQAPVQIVFTPEETLAPDAVVLIHIDPATKVETYVFPDSYDETGNSFTFTLDGFSPILIGTLDSSPTYTTGSVITVSDLQNNSVNALGFMRQISDYLGDENHLAAISSTCGQDDTCVDYLLRLSSKALASFMALPSTHPSGLSGLKTVMFKPQPYSLANTSAYDEYWAIRSSLMKTLYRVTNMNSKGIDGAELTEYGTRNSKDIESDIQGSILGQRDGEGRYYFPMMAYRVLRLGCTLPDGYFNSILHSLDSKVSPKMSASIFSETWLPGSKGILPTNSSQLPRFTKKIPFRPPGTAWFWGPGISSATVHGPHTQVYGWAVRCPTRKRTPFPPQHTNLLQSTTCLATWPKP